MLPFRGAVAAGLMVACMGALLAGCSSSGGPTGGAPMSGSMEPGVVCNKCRVVFAMTPYTVPGYEGPRVVGYFSDKQTVCDGCAKHAEEYFSTGKLSDCPECRGTMLAAQPRDMGPAPTKK